MTPLQVGVSASTSSQDAVSFRNRRSSGTSSVSTDSFPTQRGGALDSYDNKVLLVLTLISVRPPVTWTDTPVLTALVCSL